MISGLTSALLIFGALCPSVKAQEQNLRVKINEETGGFQIYLSDVLWFSSGDIWVCNNGKQYSTQDKSLTLKETSSHSTKLEWGSAEVTTFKWESSDQFHFTTYAKIYQDVPAVVFGQQWDDGGHNTSCNIHAISLWPSFKPEDLHNTGYMTYYGNFAAFMKFGTFDSSSQVFSDIDGGFPLNIFDKNMENTLVISPLDTFMSATQAAYTPSGYKIPIFGFGIVPEVESVPKGYSIETILVGGRNVTGTMGKWGELLRTKYKKEEKYRLSDQSINYLGYYTDNGACYYYGTGEFSNYEEAILAIKQKAVDSGIPYRYLQLDSWWYYRGNAGGVKNWTAMPSIFPHGIGYLSDKTDWPIIAHNRYWSNDTDYAKQNGGKFDFILDKNGFALPTDASFWQFLLSTAKDDWNLMVYEQDWLDVEYSSLNELLSELNLGQMWLDQMGEAAMEQGLTIQYCMPWTRHILQSLTNSAVTQIRVSDDYHPGNGQWQVGDTTIMAHAMGLAAFKDTFRTVTTEPHCKFMQPEPYPALETYVAALTGGPIGPSDTVETFNRTLIMSTCMADGLLLKPTRPAMSLDATFLFRAFGEGGPNGQVTVAYTEISGLTWYYILVGNNSRPYDLVLSQLPPSFSVKPASTFPSYIGTSHQQLGVFPSTTITLSKNTDSILLPSCGEDNFQSLILSPVLPGTSTAFFGELDKVVSISEQRFGSVLPDKDGGYVVHVTGAAGETVNLWSYNGSDKSVHRAKCQFKSAGTKSLTITDNGEMNC